MRTEKKLLDKKALRAIKGGFGRPVSWPGGGVSGDVLGPATEEGGGESETNGRAHRQPVGGATQGMGGNPFWGG